MNTLKNELFLIIKDFCSNKDIAVDQSTQLIGDYSVLDSIKLVAVCIALEDKSRELGFDFDWTSDSAMSQTKSMFRTAGSLVDEFIMQMKDAEK
jgi:acyl carrier protein